MNARRKLARSTARRATAEARDGVVFDSRGIYQRAAADPAGAATDLRRQMDAEIEKRERAERKFAEMFERRATASAEAEPLTAG